MDQKQIVRIEQNERETIPVRKPLGGFFFDKLLGGPLTEFITDFAVERLENTLNLPVFVTVAYQVAVRHTERRAVTQYIDRLQNIRLAGSVFTHDKCEVGIEPCF